MGVPKTVEQYEEELETLRIQLAGCGVAALRNTRESMAEQIIPDDNMYYTASYGDVINAVRREINYREALKQIAKSHSPLTMAGMVQIAQDALLPEVL